MQLFLEIPSGMGNSVGPDQTAPSGAVWSGSTLFFPHAVLCSFYNSLLYDILGHVLFLVFFLNTDLSNSHTDTLK